MSEVFQESQFKGLRGLPPKNRSKMYVNVLGSILKEVEYGYQTISSRANYCEAA